MISPKAVRHMCRILTTQLQNASRSLLTYVERTVPPIKSAQKEMMHHVYITNSHVGEGVSEKLLN
jgi:hypothetical protein